MNPTQLVFETITNNVKLYKTILFYGKIYFILVFPISLYILRIQSDNLGDSLVAIIFLIIINLAILIFLVVINHKVKKLASTNSLNFATANSFVFNDTKALPETHADYSGVLVKLKKIPIQAVGVIDGNYRGNNFQTYTVEFPPLQGNISSQRTQTLDLYLNKNFSYFRVNSVDPKSYMFSDPTLLMNPLSLNDLQQVNMPDALKGKSLIRHLQSGMAQQDADLAMSLAGHLVNSSIKYNIEAYGSCIRISMRKSGYTQEDYRAMFSIIDLILQMP